MAGDNQESNFSAHLLSPSFSFKDNVLKVKMSEAMAHSGTETQHWGARIKQPWGLYLTVLLEDF